MTSDDRRSGMVLITVLWSIALLSALAMAASTTFRTFSGVMAVGRDRVQADALLTAGLEAAAAVAAASGDRPLRETETTVSLSAGAVRTRLSDEGGRVDIGKAPVELIAALLRSIDVPTGDADGIAREIAASRKPEDDPGRAGSRAGDATAQPGNDQPFTDVRQLINIPGLTPEQVAALAPLVTVFGSETINPLTAPAEVIAVLPGVDPGRLSTFLDMRRGSAADADRVASLLGPAGQYLKVKPPKAISVELAAQLGDGYAAGAEAVIVLLPEDRQPYRVLVWNPLPSRPGERP